MNSRGERIFSPATEVIFYSMWHERAGDNVYGT
ncbi:hypothetical protein FHS66_003660 [Pacificitalea manganoxidans]|jgi:hypothetical protein|nr:hypothetical protein [Pacificitalea manganoxidans]